MKTYTSAIVYTDNRGFAPRNIYSVFQMLGQPIQDRHREHEDRPKAFEELGKKLQLYMKVLDSFKQKVYFLIFNHHSVQFLCIAGRV